MAFTMTYTIAERYLTKPSKRRSGLLLSPGVRFIVAHDTGNPDSTASANVSYYERSRDQESASAHLFVDDKEIIECIPALASNQPEKAWHVLYNVTTDNQLYGVNANDAAIGVEYCFGQRINADEAYRKYVWVIAYACNKFGLDPSKSVVGHFFLDPHRKTDPVTGLAHSRRTYEQLLRDVVLEYNACTGTAAAAWGQNKVRQSGAVTTAMKVNVRKGSPSTRAEIHQVLPPGTAFTYAEVVEDGEPVNGNPKWYGDGNSLYIWSGAARA